jgi:hypothetical protein
MAHALNAIDRPSAASLRVEHNQLPTTAATGGCRVHRRQHCWPRGAGAQRRMHPHSRLFFNQTAVPFDFEAHARVKAVAWLPQ